MKEKYFKQFSDAPLLPEEREYLEHNKQQLLDSEQFLGCLTFGTGGMRQLVELGTNRLNLYNIAKLSLSVLEWLSKNKISSQEKSVVIGYDSRNTSVMFSYLVYHLMKSKGLTTKIFRQPTPTPLVSFAVRQLEANIGVILTASHNPPQYNGFKLMGSNGAQIISPDDEIIQTYFLESSYSSLPQDIHQWKDLLPSEEDIIEEEIILAYIERIRKEDFVTSGKKEISVLYSPLHGTGGWSFQRVFSELGYQNFSILKEQAKPDGDFPTVTSPNPEDQSSFEKLKENSGGAKILIATDPDADRIGLSFLRGRRGDRHDYVFLNGNQIGCLILKSLTENLSKTMPNPYICKTIVTTELQKKIAHAYGIRTIETLTGFKYIADVLEKDPQNYLFGGEESFGYLPVTWVRDKDSISSAIAITELANKKDLLQELDDIYTQFGLYHEELYSIQLSNDSLSLIDKLKAGFLNSQSFVGKYFFSREVIDYINLNHKSSQNGDEPVTKNGRDFYHSLPEANVLQLWLKPEGRITIRPSGTEPKIKVYVSIQYPEDAKKGMLTSAKESLKKEAKHLVQDFLDFLGIAHQV